MKFSLWRCPILANQPAYSQKKEGNQATAPGFQPSGGIASTTRALTHAWRSQYLAKHKGEDRATADRRGHKRDREREWYARLRAIGGKNWTLRSFTTTTGRVELGVWMAIKYPAVHGKHSSTHIGRTRKGWNADFSDADEDWGPGPHPPPVQKQPALPIPRECFNGNVRAWQRFAFLLKVAAPRPTNGGAGRLPLKIAQTIYYAPTEGDSEEESDEDMKCTIQR